MNGNNCVHVSDPDGADKGTLLRITDSDSLKKKKKSFNPNKVSN